MKRLLALLLTIVLLLASCSSFGTLVRSQMEGLPSWVHNPQVRGDQVAFIGKGVSTVAYNARLAAYEDILAQISRYVGEDVAASYYRELTTTSQIADFNLSVTSEHQRSEKGSIQIFLLARLDESLLSARQTIIYRQTLEREERIAALIREADSAYRANDDTRAITRYLEAAAVAAEGPVLEKKHESAPLVDRAVTAIKALRISFKNSDEGAATVTVQLRRRRRLISSRVVNAPVRASFSAYNSLGSPYDDSLLFNTASQGSFLFVPHSELMTSEGRVTFSLDLFDVLAGAANLPQPLLSQVTEALAQVSTDFSYARRSPLQGRTVLAEIQEYTLDGTVHGGSLALSSFVATFDRSRVDVSAIDLASTELEDQITEVEERFTGDTLAYIGSVGVVGEDRAYDKAVVVAVGRLHLYDAGQGRVIFDTGDVEAVAQGATIEEARINAFDRFGTIAASRSIAHLFTL